MDREKKIYVFADFLSFKNELIGTIYVSQTRGKEFYSFEYEQEWIEQGYMVLDPDLQLYRGRQYINDDKNIFGIFADSCPDRWGRRLMKRREELQAKKAEVKPRKLLESDYLLGVYDEDGKVNDLLLDVSPDCDRTVSFSPSGHMLNTVKMLNICRDKYLKTKDKKYWWQMIQLLPTSYNQRRTVMLNYEVLANIYKSRNNHKLDEWRALCNWIKTLPYSELITRKDNNYENM